MKKKETTTAGMALARHAIAAALNPARAPTANANNHHQNIGLQIDKPSFKKNKKGFLPRRMKMKQ